MICNTNVPVLVVEDDHVNKLVLVKFLQQWGVDVETVEDGLSCLDRLLSKKYAGLLIDIKIPGPDGLEVVSDLRSGVCHEHNNNIPVVAVTGCATSDELRNMLTSGINACLVKPYTQDELYRILTTHVFGSI